MTASAIRCVVFDLDDTLYLERDYVRSGFDAVGRHLEKQRGLQGFAAVAFREFEAGRRGDIFDRAFVLLDQRPEQALVQELVEVYRSHEPTIALQPDVLECLEALSGKVELALVTDGPVGSQRAKVAALQLDRWISIRIITSELGDGFGKPHPRAFEMVQERTGCSGAACVYVADNPAKDFQGPRGLGWGTVRVTRCGGLHAQCKTNSNIDSEISDLSPLTTLFDR